MTNLPTANSLNGRAIGSIFFACFGALWLTLALYAKQVLTVDRVIAVAAGLATLLLAAFWLMRQARRFPRVCEDPARSRAFNRINGIQWIVIAAVAFSFARLHIDAYVLSAITAIVGIHLFPLAKLFRYPMHNVTGAVLVLWASASMLLVPAGHLQGTTALGTGIILWLSAVVTLAIAASILRQSNPAPAPNSDSLCA
jgi:hypothetical protein